MQRSAEEACLAPDDEHEYAKLLHRLFGEGRAAYLVLRALRWDSPQGRATLQAVLTGRIALEQGQDVVAATLTALDIGQYASKDNGLDTWDEGP